MFTHLIKITPLGFLYGSMGAFLSPENLVGRSGNSFPPSSATVSGLYAHKYAVGDDRPENSKSKGKGRYLQKDNLKIAGPFWAKTENVENFYVPTPFNYQVALEDDIEKGEVARKGKITQKLNWDHERGEWSPDSQKKYDRHGSWIPIKDWNNPQTVWDSPWQYVPHLHPRISEEQRVVDENNDRGSLFLENGVQMHPETCLIYMTTEKIDGGWYRFGGEGHLVELECWDIEDRYIKQLLQEAVGDYFALITPAVWGSNRFSHRFPIVAETSEENLENENRQPKTVPEWEKAHIMTERAKPYRYRLGGEGKTKRLSRGRYAVPAGTVYQLQEGKSIDKSWFKWDKSWFPDEGYCYNRWGCGLALPLKR